MLGSLEGNSLPGLLNFRDDGVQDPARPTGASVFSLLSVGPDWEPGLGAWLLQEPVGDLVYLISLLGAW